MEKLAALSVNSQVEGLEDLLAYNELCQARFRVKPLFSLIKQGVLNDDENKRQLFFDYMQIFADHFQVMMYARQATCCDDKFSPVFLEHLSEEIGHDDLLRQRDNRKKLFDPILNAISVWFIHQMSVLDNVEKTAVMHLVLETTGDFYHSLADSVLSRYLKSDYYGAHAEHDENHVAMGADLLKDYPTFVYRRLHALLEEAWAMMGAMVDRVHALIVA